MKTKLINLAHGGKVLYSPRKEKKGISFIFHFNAGSINDPVGKNGLAHFAEHAIFSFRTKNKTREEKMKLLQDLPINGSTSLFNVLFYASCVKQELKNCIEFFIDSFTNLIFTKEDFKKEQPIILDEIKTRKKTNKKEDAYNTIPKMLVGKHSHAYKISSAGNEQTFKKITLKDLKFFIKNYFTLNNLVLTICGNVSKKQLKEIISEVEKLPVSNISGLNRYELGDVKKPFFNYTQAVEKKQDLITIRYKLSPQENLKSSAKQIYLNLLGQSFKKEVFNFFRTQKNYCYSASSWVQIVSNTSFLNISIPTQSENTSKILNDFPEFLASLKKENLKKDVDNEKQSMINTTNFDYIPVDFFATKVTNYFTKYSEIFDDTTENLVEKIIDSIQFEKIYSSIKNTLKTKPYLSLVANDEKFKDFDYKNFCKKLKINLE